MLEEGKTAPVDLSELETSSVEATLELRNPFTGEILRHPDGRPMTITLLSNESDEFDNLMRQQQDRRTQHFARTRQMQLSGTSDKDAIELLVAITRRWDLMFDKKPLDSTPEEFRKLYSNPKFRWLRRDVDTFAGNLANFSKR